MCDYEWVHHYIVLASELLNPFCVHRGQWKGQFLNPSHYWHRLCALLFLEGKMDVLLSDTSWRDLDKKRLPLPPLTVTIAQVPLHANGNQDGIYSFHFPTKAMFVSLSKLFCPFDTCLSSLYFYCYWAATELSTCGPLGKGIVNIQALLSFQMSVNKPVAAAFGYVWWGKIRGQASPQDPCWLLKQPPPKSSQLNRIGPAAFLVRAERLCITVKSIKITFILITVWRGEHLALSVSHRSWQNHC